MIRLPRAIFRADPGQDLVLEDVLLALCQRPSRLDLYAVLLHGFHVLPALEEGMALNLVDGRNHLCVQAQIGKPLRVFAYAI